MSRDALAHYICPMIDGKENLEPALEPEAEEDEEQTLPEAEEAIELADGQSLASGRDAILRFAKLAPSTPGVYRMAGPAGDVLYVGKAKNLKKRIIAYARPTGHVSRIERMIAATATIEFVSTATETEALLLEANLIKRLRPRFNVLLRDDKIVPLHPAHRRSRARRRSPSIAARAAARATTTARSRRCGRSTAPSRRWSARSCIRSCSDAVYESRTRPCLLFQIKRCSAPCTGEIVARPTMPSWWAKRAHSCPGVAERCASNSPPRWSRLPMRSISSAPPCCATGSRRSRRSSRSRASTCAASMRPTCSQLHQDGGFTCIEVFFFRTGQNWGNRAYFPRADRSLSAARCWARSWRSSTTTSRARAASCSRTRSPSASCWREALAIKSGRKVEIGVPQRGERKLVIDQALANAREALGRKLADSASQQRLLAGARRRRSACRSRRSASRSTTTATSRARTRSAP